MKMKNYIAILLIVSTMLLNGSLTAQTHTAQTHTRSVDTKIVEVTRVYEGLIINDNRTEIPLKVNDSIFNFSQTFNYTITPSYLPVFSVTSSINPANIMTPAENPITNYGYIRLGMGYPLAPLGDLYLHNRFTDNSFVNLYYNHRSYWGNVPLITGQPADAAVDIPTSITDDNMQNDMGFAIEHRMGNIYMNAGVDYKHHNFVFRGHDAGYLSYLSQHHLSYIDAIRSDPGFIRSALKQTYQFATANIGVASKNLHEGFSYKADFTFGYTCDNARQNISEQTSTPVREFIGGANGFITKTFDLTHTIGISFDYMAYNKGNASKWTDWKLTATPSYSYRKNGIYFFAGLDVEAVYASKNVPKRDSGDLRIRLYPNVTITGALNEYFTIYAQVGGRTAINTYQKIAMENPYILPGLVVENTNTPFDVTIGVRGKMFDLMGYSFFGRYAFVDSMYFYVNSRERVYSAAYPTPFDTKHAYLLHNFDVVYSKTSLFMFGTDIDYTNAGFEARLRGRYYFYAINNKGGVTAAYQKPAWEIGLDARYQYKNYLFQIGITSRGTTPYLYQYPESPVDPYSGDNPIIITETRHMSMYIDLGAQVEYRINKRLSAFVYGQNLLNWKYQNYYLYYAHGILGGGGITFVL